MYKYKLVKILFIVGILPAIFCCSITKKIHEDNSLVIQPRSVWNAAPPKPFKQHKPVRITVHHEGTRLELKDSAAKKIRAIQKWGMGPDRNWADIFLGGYPHKKRADLKYRLRPCPESSCDFGSVGTYGK